MQLHYTINGQGNPVLLVHGMAGSSRYWEQLIALRPKDYQFIAVDLLGFGQSPAPTQVTYDYETHLAAIEETLSAAGISGPMTVVAHSMGALLALRLAATRPQLVDRLILCGVPYYPDVATARRDITKGTKIRELAYYGPTSKVLCTAWCRRLRPITRFLAPLYLRNVPKAVAVDSLKHTWQAYSESMDYVIERQDIARDLDHIQRPVTFFYGSEDTCSDYLQAAPFMQSNKYTIEVFPGLTHHLPLEKPELLAGALGSKTGL